MGVAPVWLERRPRCLHRLQCSFSQDRVDYYYYYYYYYYYCYYYYYYYYYYYHH